MSSGDPPPQQPKKPSRFKPKLPPRRVVRAPTTRSASADDDAVRAAGLLIHQQRSQQVRRNGKAGGTDNSLVPSDSSTQGEPFQTSTTMDSGNSSNNASSSRDGNQRAPSLPSADISAGGSDFSNSVPVVTKETKKEYLGPWGNDRHPPTILPLRRPSSEDPEIVNKLEFGENQIKEPNESYATNATELGLYENNENPKLMSIQFPPNFPIPRSFFEPQQPDTSRSAVPMIKAGPSAKGKEIVTRSPLSGEGKIFSPRNKATAPRLPPPHAKVQVYKSGKSKLKMGELLFNVSPGIHSDTMAQDLVAMNIKEKDIYQLGEIENKMLVTPDFSDLLDMEE